ncbi:hypothetical protein [Ferrimonas marina]|uniref:DUF2335 domain-containing protein n=1 Tax=Ferrimonas marina TaxID=299255 RepID=A0A1M5S0M6_9GAMM|nr:hypothetical protein [Ferrimonas marina]SHH32147.1 hypothetical protein SAMN02745129_1830 [Ferrimonas marina]
MPQSALYQAPDYTKYDNQALLEAFDGIDGKRFPARKASIAKELHRRKLWRRYWAWHKANQRAEEQLEQEAANELPGLLLRAVLWIATSSTVFTILIDWQQSRGLYIGLAIIAGLVGFIWLAGKKAPSNQ